MFDYEIANKSNTKWMKKFR